LFISETKTAWRCFYITALRIACHPPTMATLYHASTPKLANAQSHTTVPMLGSF